MNIIAQRAKTTQNLTFFSISKFIIFQYSGCFLVQIEMIFLLDPFSLIYTYCDVCFAPQLHSYKPDDNRLPFS